MEMKTTVRFTRDEVKRLLAAEAERRLGMAIVMPLWTLGVLSVAIDADVVAEMTMNHPNPPHELAL